MNNIQIIGRTTQDIQIKDTQNGKKYCKFRVAVPRSFDRNKSDFFTCAAFGKTAEILANNVKKGDRVAISGTLQTNEWETEQGQKRVDYEIIIQDVDFIEPKKQNTQKEEQLKIQTNTEDFTEDDIDDLPFKF